MTQDDLPIVGSTVQIADGVQVECWHCQRQVWIARDVWEILEWIKKTAESDYPRVACEACRPQVVL